MKEHIKAALLSALVLPGVGQIYRGRRLKGGILVLMVTILLLALVVLAVLALQDAMHAARFSGKTDVTALAESLRRWVPATVALGAAFGGIWVYGIVDAFLDRDRVELGDKEK